MSKRPWTSNVRSQIIVALGLTAALAGLILWLLSTRSKPSMGSPPKVPATEASSDLAPIESEARMTIEGAAPGTEVALRGPFRLEASSDATDSRIEGQLFFQAVEARTEDVDIRTTVKSSVWSVQLPAGRPLTPVRFVRGSDGRIAKPKSVVLQSAADDGVTIEAEWAPGLRLHVLDRSSATDISDVEVVVLAKEIDPRAECAFPSSEWRTGIERLTGASPLPLPCYKTSRIGWARTPHHAWQRFSFSGCEGDRTVLLQPACALSCFVVGDEVPPGTAVRLRDPRSIDTIRGSRSLGANGTAEFLALPPGPVLVSLERSQETSFGRMLAYERIELVPGTQRVTLDPSARTRSPAALTVTAMLDDVDPECPPVLSVVPRRTLPAADEALTVAATREEPASGSSSTTWHVHVLPLGEYVITLAPYGHTREVVVSEGETTRVDFGHCVLAELITTLLDDSSGAPLDAGAVHTRPQACTLGEFWMKALPTGTPGTRRQRISPGMYVVRGSLGLDHEFSEIAFEVRPGVNAATLTLRRGRGIPIQILALEGTTRAPIATEWWAQTEIDPVAPCRGKFLGLRPYPGKPRLEEPSNRAHFWVDSPGRYRVMLPHVPGYRETDPMEVEVVADHDSELVVQMLPE